MADSEIDRRLHRPRRFGAKADLAPAVEPLRFFHTQLFAAYRRGIGEFRHRKGKKAVESDGLHPLRVDEQPILPLPHESMLRALQKAARARGVVEERDRPDRKSVGYGKSGSA